MKIIEFEIVSESKKKVNVEKINKQVSLGISPGGMGSGGVRGSLLLRIDGVVVFRLAPDGGWDTNTRYLDNLEEEVG